MIFTLVALFISLIATYIAYKAARMLWQNSWFVGFCRGLFGLALLALAALIGLTAFDVYSYKQVLQEQVVATINFDRIEDQHFFAVLADKEGKEQRVELRGDQWQLDARIVKWEGYLATFGIKPAFRLERLSGRYYDIEKETMAARTAYTVHNSLYGLDIWRILNTHPDWVPVIDAVYGSATYLPMKDGALFEITLSNTGLLARPINAAAREAVAEFE
ncbi:cation/multidrug efflux pump [Cellvibrio sp. KY-GH-1]|uniref:cation/multidrug efflux pump n=1 Tax=Cellvibrio sp. KY-GH-1 TaxID=2303332 RepID=UPI00124555EA|nr:cation/multidrug efflux pump [Cellvibrio sp. KY-GH-1]QEY15050.1 cation/multidrug efflux pump [Cellvibrio sp. KY-GH-1]